MRDDLVGLLERADLALGSSAGVVGEEALAPLIDAVAAVRTRLAYPDDVLVVALAGGTGSGKSSLFNVFTGEDLVDVGGVRPTTSTPAAAVPSSAGSSLDGYLDRLGVSERHVYHGPGICLIDLPDTDSVEVEHRHRVAAVLPLVDMVVWVTDPEKYRDARLHGEYLNPMADYAPQLLFVLNQIDRLGRGEAGHVLDDLVQALEADGIEGPTVVPMATEPPSGPPIGLQGFTAALESRRQRRETLYGKLLTDLADTSRRLAAETGIGLDFDARAREVVEAAAALLVTGETTGATDTMTDFLDRLADESGGVTAAKIEAIAASVTSHVRRIEAELASQPPPPRRGWLGGRRTAPDPAERESHAGTLLTESVIRPTRAVLARRAVAVASVVELALEVESLRSGARR